MEYKDFIQLTDVVVYKYCNRKMRQEFSHDSDNWNEVFANVVKGYYKFDPSKAPPGKTAETLGIKYGHYKILELIRKFSNKKKRKTKTVNYDLNILAQRNIDTTQQREDALEKIHYLIHNSGLSNTEIDIMTKYVEYQNKKIMAEEENISLSKVRNAIHNSMEKIRKAHNFEDIEKI